MVIVFCIRTSPQYFSFRRIFRTELPLQSFPYTVFSSNPFNRIAISPGCTPCTKLLKIVFTISASLAIITMCPSSSVSYPKSPAVVIFWVPFFMRFLIAQRIFADMLRDSSWAIEAIRLRTISVLSSREYSRSFSK